MAVVRTTYFNGEIIIGMIISSHCECLSHIVTLSVPLSYSWWLRWGAFSGGDFSGTHPCDKMFVLESL